MLRCSSKPLEICGSFLALALLLGLGIDTVLALGAMTTLAAMRGSFTDAKNSFALCVLRAGTMQPFCWGTFVIDSNISPPGNSLLWAMNGGAYFACGLRADSRSPLCWGQSPGSDVPDEFKNVSYAEISCGGWHACAVRSNSSSTAPGQIDCWGASDFGQISRPDRPSQMVSITAGDYFSCALVASTRRPRCWGKISKSGNTTEVIPHDSVFFRIFAGRTHVCGILLASREALCWGNNESGQCDPPKGLSFATLAAGIDHSCGIRDDSHEVVCWGDNRHGQLEVPSDLKFSTIAAGDFYTCGVTLGERQLLCWGSARAPKTIRVKDGLCVADCEHDQYDLMNTDVKDCAGPEEKICLPCARCKAGSYETSPCVPFSDRSCSSCKWCFSREKRDHPCRRTCPAPRSLSISGPQPSAAVASEPAALDSGNVTFRPPVVEHSDQSFKRYRDVNGVMLVITISLVTIFTA
ncbi:putative receptor protein kinase CRINKLY4 [Selaginella moellendorffii]|uniref:putative receptor protein kinase CRINKLY4 n=1 Tax=Selaginella moellendorffii TaxID=88036 RepID=UPI000D1CFCF6|nr:putative receptor protein kinase CRINKLY4 [Selaginella moellendorffii]|eukprot:XP_024537260.1 putative receptor protein kinase CRINKLY4 [Selaginella moellendorffii]